MSQPRKWIDRTNTNTVVTIISIVVGLPSFVGYLKGVLTLEMLVGIVIVIMFILLVISMFSYNKILDKYIRAEKDLGKVDDKIKGALAPVYEQKRIEIEKLDKDLAFWKDRASNQKDEIDKLNIKILELTQKFNETENRMLIAEQKAEKLQGALDSMTIAYRKKSGIVEGSSSLTMGYSAVAEGSPDHLMRMSEDSLYERAKRLAKDAGIEISEE